MTCAEHDSLVEVRKRLRRVAATLAYSPSRFLQSHVDARKDVILTIDTLSTLLYLDDVPDATTPTTRRLPL
jgi:hypothetical protein